jgi:hypothetical protein
MIRLQLLLHLQQPHLQLLHQASPLQKNNFLGW